MVKSGETPPCMAIALRAAAAASTVAAGWGEAEFDDIFTKCGHLRAAHTWSRWSVDAAPVNFIYFPLDTQRNCSTNSRLVLFKLPVSSDYFTCPTRGLIRYVVTAIKHSAASLTLSVR
jgi:hypothetical protein